MKEFGTSTLTRDIGDVLHAAAKGPVKITQRGKARFVLMSIEDFERREKLNPRRVFRTGEEPPEIRAILEEAFKRLPEEKGED